MSYLQNGELPVCRSKRSASIKIPFDYAISQVCNEMIYSKDNKPRIYRDGFPCQSHSCYNDKRQGPINKCHSLFEATKIIEI